MTPKKVQPQRREGKQARANEIFKYGCLLYFFTFTSQKRMKPTQAMTKLPKGISFAINCQRKEEFFSVYFEATAPISIS